MSLTRKAAIADNEHYTGVAARRLDIGAQWEHVARYLAFGMLNMPSEAFDHIVKTERERLHQR
jgi:hypothetical protein